MEFRDPLLAPTTIAEGTSKPVVRLHERVCFWAPVWLPMTVLLQLALLGLHPALNEQQRLERAETELTRRLDRETTEKAALERWTRAQSDPIYLERERRKLRDASAESAPR
jgi:hypothetical protein